MTSLGTSIASLLVAAGLAAGIAGADTGARAGAGASPRTALVVDASLARDGRDLIGARLDGVDADVRVPRTADEARINVRYFDELGYRVVVAGPRASAAADATGIAARHETDLPGAVAAAGR